jgi:hypothetical protein
MTGAAASSIFQVQALIPAGPSRTRRNAGEPAIPAARDQAAVFHDGNRLTLIGRQRHAAGDHFRRRRSEQGEAARESKTTATEPPANPATLSRPSSGRRLPPGRAARRDA